MLSDIKKLEQEAYKVTTYVWGIRIVLLFVVMFLLWAFFAELDEVSIAEGEIIPEGEIKTIQHLEGGIIEEFYVGSGSAVSKGDKLILLNLASGGLRRSEMEARRDALILKQTRIKAVIDQRAPKFPLIIIQRYPELVKAEMDLFSRGEIDFQRQKDILKQQVEQSYIDVTSLKAKIQSEAQDLVLAQKKYNLVKKLRQQKSATESQLLEAEVELHKIKSIQSQSKNALPKLESLLKERELKLNLIHETYRKNANEELTGIEARLAELRKSLEVASDQANRAVIRSPIDGTVKKMAYHTVGGVVSPGKPIMEIVPSSATLLVRAKVMPKDIAFVKIGQRAVVKISSYDFFRYGGLEGKVEFISASTEIDRQSGAPYYEVTVRVFKSFLGDIKGQNEITPGMQAMVDIHTGTRTVMNFLIKPVLKIQHEAFRER